jgi:hypothetical protein
MESVTFTQKDRKMLVKMRKSAISKYARIAVSGYLTRIEKWQIPFTDSISRRTKNGRDNH